MTPYSFVSKQCGIRGMTFRPRQVKDFGLLHVDLNQVYSTNFAKTQKYPVKPPEIAGQILDNHGDFSVETMLDWEFENPSHIKPTYFN